MLETPFFFTLLSQKKSSTWGTVYCTPMIAAGCAYHYENVIYTAGADLGFSRGGGADFKEKIENFVDHFLGRSNFSELFQSPTKTLFWFKF